MNNPIPSSKILRRYLAGECTEAERRLVNEWYQSLDSGVEETTSWSESENLYGRIQSRITEMETEDHSSAPVAMFRTYAIRVAAVLCAILGLMYYFYHQRKPMQERAVASVPDSVFFSNQQKKVVRCLLPDSSQVWLKPGARLSYCRLFRKRQVQFSGEGFFDVTPDRARPFMIFSGAITTRVLGTSFNVRAHADQESYQVNVVTGSVEVGSPQSGKKVILRPKQQMTFEKSSKTLHVLTLADEARAKEIWEEATLAFDEASMREVAEKLSATFQVRIEFANPDIEKCRLKVDFNHQRLPEVLEMIDALLGTTYQMDGARIVIAGEGCK